MDTTENNRNIPYQNANNQNNNNNVNMYFPPDGQHNIPVQENLQVGYGYNDKQNHQSYSYPVPQVNQQDANFEHSERANFVLPESAKFVMILCSICCCLIFFIILLMK